MVAAPLIDTAFDVRTDAGGRDPDRYSATLRRYHRQLWGKPLPGGAMFDLDARLHHNSDLGEFWLSSDSIAHTYTGWSRPRRLVEVLAATSSEEVLSLGVRDPVQAASRRRVPTTGWAGDIPSWR